MEKKIKHGCTISKKDGTFESDLHPKTKIKCVTFGWCS